MAKQKISLHLSLILLSIFLMFLALATSCASAIEAPLWQTHTIQATPNKSSENLTDVVWSPDGRNIGFLSGNTVGFVDNQTGLHHSRTLKEIQKLKIPQFSNLDFAPDGKTLWFSASINSQPIEKVPFYNYEFVLASHQIKRHNRGSLPGWFGKRTKVYVESIRNNGLTYKHIVRTEEYPSEKVVKEVPLKIKTSFPLPTELAWFPPSAYVSPNKEIIAATWTVLRGSSKADFRHVDLGLYLFDANTGILKNNCWTTSKVEASWTSGSRLIVRFCIASFLICQSIHGKVSFEAGKLQMA